MQPVASAAETNKHEPSIPFANETMRFPLSPPANSSNIGNHWLEKGRGKSRKWCATRGKRKTSSPLPFSSSLPSNVSLRAEKQPRGIYTNATAHKRARKTRLQDSLNGLPRGARVAEASRRWEPAYGSARRLDFPANSSGDLVRF